MTTCQFLRQCPLGHGGIFRCLSIHPFILCPPPSAGWLQISILRPDLGPQISPQISSLGLKLDLQASNQPSRPQISPSGLKSALQASNQPSRPKISSPGLKSALQASEQSSRPQISTPGGLKSTLKVLSLPPNLKYALQFRLKHKNWGVVGLIWGLIGLSRGLCSMN